MVLIPTCFEYIIGTDAQFETATSGQIKTLMLFYKHKVVTRSIGLVLYHNKKTNLTSLGELIEDHL